jgi:ferredoxin-NADP reductase
MGVVKAEFLSREMFGEDLAIFKFKVPEMKSFIPGQCNALIIQDADGMMISRLYSIASTPGDLPVLEYFIRLVKKGGLGDEGKGVFTSKLFEASEEELRDFDFKVTDSAKGKMFLSEFEKRKVICVGTGTGLGPFCSQIRSEAKEGGKIGKFIVVHGVANLKDFCYADELKAYEKNFGLKYVEAFSRGDTGDVNYSEELFLDRKGNIGRVTLEEIRKCISEGTHKNTKINELLGEDLDPKKHLVLLCGNPYTIENIKMLLVEGHGFKDMLDVLYEEYWKPDS